MHWTAQLATIALTADGWESALVDRGMYLSQAAGAALITAIWQGAVIAACVGLSLRLSKRISAGLRFAIWSGGFVTVLGLPFLPALWKAGPWSAAAAIQLPVANHYWLQLDARWSVGIALVWAAASLYRAVDLTVHAVRLRRLWKSSRPAATQPPAMMEMKLWGRKSVEICTSNSIDRPSVLGFFAPRILIPDWLLSQMTRDELEQIVLHETEHLRRGDDWTNLLQKVSLVVFPLNPVLLWMERQLCLEREMACDEAVIRTTRAPKAYAACLTNLAERGLTHRLEALSLGAWQRRPELVRRVHSILLRRPGLGPFGTRGLAVVMAGGLFLATVELASCPQFVTFTSPVPRHELASRSLSDSGGVDTSGDAVFNDSLRAVPVSSNPAGNMHVVELRATLPAHAGIRFKSAGAAQAALKPWDEPGNPRSTQPRPEMTNFEPSGQQLAGTTLKARPGTNQPLSTPESGFIVFTAWEEIEPATSAATAVIASEQAGSATALPTPETQSNVASGESAAPRRVTVTQLVFRVVPASYRSTSQAIVPLRDGWLVIQL